jgi:DNA-binding CsgD family transcriptional regulator
MSLELLGNCYLKLGDVERAKAALDEAIPLFGEMASRWGIGDGYDGFCHCLILCANIACARGRFERAVLLLGAATAAREPVDSWMESWRQLTESTLDEARSHLGDQRFAAAWERGKSLSVKEAVTCTIEPPGGADQAATPAVAFATQQSGLFPDGLSRREVDVAVLLVEGLTNREIGGRLYISERTVANHVQSILNKTGSGNRAEAAAYAIRHGLTN